MNILEHCEILEGDAAFRPVGAASFEATIAAIATAMRFCAERQITRILVNTTGIVGIKVPALIQRYHMAENLAKASVPGMRLVMVAEPSLIDAHKFGATAALNRGLRANVFPTESEAFAWLLAK